MLSILRHLKFLILFVNLLASLFFIVQVNAQTTTNNGPTLNDPHLRVEVIFSGIKFPSSMVFLGPNDILVLEKNNGTVKRIVNGKMLPQALLEVNVSTISERGMLGIAVSKQANHKPTYVFLYFTEVEKKKGKDGGEVQAALGNRLYRYELLNDKLTNPKLLLDLPADPGPAHNGGKIVIGRDHNVYVVEGDLDGSTLTQNINNGTEPDGRGGILRVTQDGKVVENGVLGNSYPLNLYYAYGIRNSFGLDFDPVTGKLWDTENGPYFGDEINLVEPGFNSGWKKVQGFWNDNKGHIGQFAPIHPEGLVNFEGKGKYSPPEFTWKSFVGVTGLSFLNSDKLGKQYENDLFVGDFHYGNIYNFKLNEDRTGLYLKSPLSDRIADNKGELQSVIFGQGFGGITDIKVGPDGYLYILSIQQGGADCNVMKNNKYPCVPFDAGVQGTIFRIFRAN